MHWLLLLVTQAMLLVVVLFVLSDSWIGILLAAAGCGGLTWLWFIRRPVHSQRPNRRDPAPEADRADH